MRVARPVNLEVEQQRILEQQARSRPRPARLVERARIVLRAGAGWQDKQIAAQLGITPEKAARWRQRFLDRGLPGLAKDAPRPGRPRRITAPKIKHVLHKTRREKPEAAPHWSTRTMAAAVGLSEASVRRFWHAHGLKPHSLKTFKVSNHAVFAALNTLDSPVISTWLARHPRFRVHFTPTGSSWLNMVERFFRDLTQPRLRRGVFRDVEELITASGAYIDQHNQTPKPFVRTAKAADILERVKRARAASNNRHSK